MIKKYNHVGKSTSSMRRHCEYGGFNLNKINAVNV